MKRILLTQGKVALVDDEDYLRLARWTWYAVRSGRTFVAARHRRKGDGDGSQTILMHREILRLPRGVNAEHINGDGLDNRRENLRERGTAYASRPSKTRPISIREKFFQPAHEH